MSLFDRLIKKATKSPCRVKIAAMGFDARGNFLGVTTNKPFLYKEGGGIHAEEALMRKRKGLKTIVICRVSALGELLPIDPCDGCASNAANRGITIKSLR